MERGLLLVRGSRERVTRWVRRGTLPVHVVPGRPWTVLVPAGPSRAMAPYRDGSQMLAAHPVRVDLRPAIGLFLDREHAVVICWPRRLLRGARWVRWTPGEGPAPVDGFPLARPADLAAVAGFGRLAGAADAVRGVLTDPGGTAEDLLQDLAALLGLPHAEVLRGTPADSLDGSELVMPSTASVERFDKVVADEQRLDAEVEEGL